MKLADHSMCKTQVFSSFRNEGPHFLCGFKIQSTCLI